MAVSHVFSNAIADFTGTITGFNSQASTTTIAATALVRPVNWNSAHNQFFTLTGNTNNSSVVSGTNIVLSGANNITLIGSTAAGQATIGISAAAGGGAPTLAFYDNMVVGGSLATSNPGQMTMKVFQFTPVNEIFPGNMSVSTLMLNALQTQSSAATWTITVSIGFYTSVNSTQLTRVFSASTTWGSNAGNANWSSSFGGPRWISIHSSQFDAAPVFSNGVRYWVALWHRTSNNAGSMTFGFYGQSTLANSGVRSGIMGQSSQTNTTLGWQRFNGIYSVTHSTAMPAAIAGSDINKSVVAVQFLPQVILNNVGSNIV